jgi:hypothetical protein
MTGTNCDLFTHNQSRSYLNHLVCYTADLVICDRGRKKKGYTWFVLIKDESMPGNIFQHQPYSA